MSKMIFLSGGSWLYSAALLRSSNRYCYGLGSRFDNDLGFRVVQDPECRVVRGGCWGSAPASVRAAYRGLRSAWHVDYGFRVACDTDERK